MNAPDQFHDLSGGHVLFQRYLIQRTLGRGGFGITYLATDTTLERPVAIKELLPQKIAMRQTEQTVVPLDEEQRERFEWARTRFLDEAKVLARFDHPNIVRIIDYFAENGTAYFAMPYLEGASLGAVLKERGLFGMDDLRALIFPILQGLREVHAGGILHRDIKPDNIWVTRQNRPVLLDFGAARAAIGLQSSEVTTIGTPSYSPIEQLAGEEGQLGPYTDIYALASVMHKCITGELPPPANSRLRTDRYLPLVSRCTHLPAHVLAAVDWALMLHETDRPQTVDQWSAALENDSAAGQPSFPQTPELAAGPPTVAVYPTRLGSAPNPLRERAPASRAALWIAAAIAIVCLAATAALFFMGTAPKKITAANAQMTTPPLGEVAKVEVSSLAGRRAGDIRDFEIIKNVSVRCCWCPPGKFTMGNSPEELRELAEVMGSAPPNDAPAHEVSLPAGFWIAKYEATADELKCIDKALRREIFAPLKAADPPESLPAADVSWNRCVEICSALDSQNPFPGWEIRLPSEQEWEYACRAGTTTTYCFGPSLNGTAANCDGNYPFPKGIENGPNQAQAVRGGSYPANPWGICDMAGNLAEWCQDLYVDPYPLNASSLPSQASSGAARVTRGGSFASYARSCRSAARANQRPDEASDTDGFRIVIAPRGGPVAAIP